MPIIIGACFGFVRGRRFHDEIYSITLSTYDFIGFGTKYILPCAKRCAQSIRLHTKNNNASNSNATELKLLQNHFQQQRKQAGLSSKSIRVGDIV